MRKVEINPGVCGFITRVQAELLDEDELKLSVQSDCPSITKMMEALDDIFEPFELCLQRPGQGPLFEYAQENFPVHVSCPAICGIIKCAEVEAGLALPKDASIKFVG